MTISDTSQLNWRMMGWARETTPCSLKNRVQARISGMVEQMSEMARESFGFLQVKIMIRANDSSGSVTIAKQA